MENFEIETSGDKPQIVESIPGWAHYIKNIGEEDMIVILWANEIFDEANPDTYSYEVEKMDKLKVMTVVGTRPEIIRLSRVIVELDKNCDHILVHTGQNYDYELNEVFFENLEIRKPDFFLESAGSSSSETIGNVIIESEKLLKKVKPDAFLILVIQIVVCLFWLLNVKRFPHFIWKQAIDALI